MKHLPIIKELAIKYKEKKVEKTLHYIDKKISDVQLSEIPTLFENVSLDIFGRLLLTVPEKYPNMMAFFPAMPPNAVQQSWTGTHGPALLMQSLAFIDTLIEGYIEIIGKPLKNSTILDYGCGWGRLIRLLYKYTPVNNIYGVDPWEKSIDLCKQYGVKANLAVSDYVPKALPFEIKFDLIFAFSVFTHLSEKTAKVVLSTLRHYISEDGLLVITIRPKEYWAFHKQGKLKDGMFRMHDENGFAFTPHYREPIDGDVTYGDASISLKYIEENYSQWDLVKTITNQGDLYQKILFLRPV
jgi:2-polyprenyl-3-methyl-5-hydroxy-6-metoxy-1,4-benzoquinol methylase